MQPTVDNFIDDVLESQGLEAIESFTEVEIQDALIEVILEMQFNPAASLWPELRLGLPLTNLFLYFLDEDDDEDEYEEDEDEDEEDEDEDPGVLLLAALEALEGCNLIILSDDSEGEAYAFIPPQSVQKASNRVGSWWQASSATPPADISAFPSEYSPALLEKIDSSLLSQLMSTTTVSPIILGEA